VVIDPSFSAAERAIITGQLSQWSGTGGSGVPFVEKTPADAGPGTAGGGVPILFISKEVPTSPTGQAEVTGFAANGRRGDSFMKINPGVTDSTALTHTVSHEMGHTFGLADCSGCSQGSSAMTLPTTADLNHAGGHDGPTQCDIDKVRLEGQYGSPPPTPTPCTPSAPPPPGQQCTWNSVSCRFDCPPSPIVVDVLGDGFDLTNALNGVNFDLNSDETAERLSWTSANSDEAWLALDRNGNGVIDNGTELFGNFTPQPDPPSGEERNGFLALAEYDKQANGGNGDGRINWQDSVFPILLLWQDTNHNGVSEQSELHSLVNLGVARLDLDYKESRRTDEHGNRFKYRAKVKDVHGAQVGRWAWDVFLLSQ
jgi:hypothetical protein